MVLASSSRAALEQQRQKKHRNAGAHFGQNLLQEAQRVQQWRVILPTSVLQHSLSKLTGELPA
jgi:hypothetical protein